VLLKLLGERESTCIDDDNVELLRFRVKIEENGLNCGFGLANYLGFRLFN
jgi:hypothetical protein